MNGDEIKRLRYDIAHPATMTVEWWAEMCGRLLSEIEQREDVLKILRNGTAKDPGGLWAVVLAEAKATHQRAGVALTQQEVAHDGDEKP